MHYVMYLFKPCNFCIQNFFVQHIVWKLWKVHKLVRGPPCTYMNIEDGKSNTKGQKSGETRRPFSVKRSAKTVSSFFFFSTRVARPNSRDASNNRDELSSSWYRNSKRSWKSQDSTNTTDLITLAPNGWFVNNNYPRLNWR